MVYRRRQARQLTWLALPAILLLFTFQYLPMGGIVLAFKNFRYDLGVWGSEWAAFDNFKFFFTSADAWRVTRNTIGLNFIFIVVGTIGSVAVAILLSEVHRKWLKQFYQTTMFFPYFLSWPVVALIVYAFLNIDLGILNKGMEWLGLEAVSWYSEPQVWPFVLTAVHFWKYVGHGAIIYYAGIMGFDRTYYEAAAVDGATNGQMRRYLTVPMLAPLVIIMFLISLGNIFHAEFGLFYMVTQDSGILYSTTDVIDTYVYRSLRTIGDIGMASAVGLYQSVVGFVLIVLVNVLIRKHSKENALF
ncbi:MULTISPECIES: ABC transporter permease [Cohnella]|uniref:ABC transporter permease n=1 Tax=Cohnella TaxID=329857 RepID=UPI001967EC23|nr:MULTISPECIES: ABC transporter permease subunit [Cohnella]MBN2984718.1 sugar ABC transporter permease [Cohnella algarum]